MSLSRVRHFLVCIFACVFLSGCATDGMMGKPTKCALIGGGTGLLLGAINSAGAAAGGGLLGAAIGGLLCRNTDKDSDLDGVADSMDQCPNTPEGMTVTDQGCPVDSDADGVADFIDQCANTPVKMAVNEFGCSDMDGDTVADNLDLCSNTPEGVKVDENGCPVQAAPANQSVGAVFFDFDSDVVSDSDKKRLDEIANTLKANNQLMIKVIGYTDDNGAPEYNMKLAKMRADNVAKYLISQGVNPPNIHPLVGGIIEENGDTVMDRKTKRKANRKVEMIIGLSL